jgi:hypothetical protein
MPPRRGPVLAGLVLALGLGFAVAAAGSGASPSLGPAPGTPDPKAMVPRTADVHAKVKRQRYYRDADFPSVISYERYFGAARLGSTRLLYLASTAEVGTSERTTASFVAYIRRALSSKQVRKDLEQSFALEESDIAFADLHVGRVVSLGAGPGSFDLPMRVSVAHVHADLHLAVFRTERLLGAVIVVGAPGSRVPVSVMTRLARLMNTRMAAELHPKNLGPPVLTGTAEVGQRLLATSGSWTESPRSFAYQWQRCDASGASCTNIAGASGTQYTLVTEDAGSTVRVSVTARNRYGSGTARSAATAVVLASQAPANTALPTITGTPQVGQTLTASTGAWTGSPTAFGYQWRRCDSAGAATYTLVVADSGSTIRVAVTATNAYGATTAVSAQTAAVG